MFKRIGFLLALFSGLGGIFCATEVFLSWSGKTLCHAETCQIVENLSLLSRPLLSAIGSLFFFVQGFFLFKVSRDESWCQPLWALASVMLGAEAIFVSRQFIDYGLHCPFCLTVAAFVLLSSCFLLLFYKKWLVFTTLIGVIGALILTPVPLKPLSLAATKHIVRGSPTEKWLLVYSSKCPHCHEVLSFCEKLKDIDLKLCPKEKAEGFLRVMGIKGVPVLIVGGENEKRILIGSGMIIAYLKGQKSFLPEIFSSPGLCEEGHRCEPLDETFPVP